jgi:hypothetical protein
MDSVLTSTFRRFRLASSEESIGKLSGALSGGLDRGLATLGTSPAGAAVATIALRAPLVLVVAGIVVRLCMNES